MARRINAAGLRLIKSFEGFEPKWYQTNFPLLFL